MSISLGVGTAAGLYGGMYNSGIYNSGMYNGGTAGAGASSGASADGESSGVIKNPGESTHVSPGRKSSPAECETCKERKYKDGSDEMVSYKTPQHISPNAAASAVRGHEQEHVSNAYTDAAQNNGKVVSANVSIKTSICPECGRSYVSGGETTTQIKYYNEDNPYQKQLKAQDAGKYTGMNLDLVG